MESTVHLQNPFSYSAGWIVFTAILTVGLSIALLLSLFMPKWKKQRAERAKQQIKVPPIPEVLVVPGMAKSRYLAMITQIEADLYAGRIDSRVAYQRMSSCTRGFFEEVTHLDVTKYTLSDIQSLKIPQLEYLVKEYYAPEFAETVMGDVRASIDKTRRIIMEWK